MDGFSPYGGAPHVVGPGSLAPQISDLGTMMDTLVQQRAHLAQIQRQQDAEDRQSAALAEKEAYGRRKQDLIEAKQNTQDRFGRAKFNQDALAKVTQGVGSGKGAGPTLFQGPNGEPSMVNFKYGVPVSRMPDPFDPQSAAAPMAAPPPAAAAPAPSPAPQAQPDVGNLPPMMQTPFVLASQRKLPIPPVASAMPDGRSMVQQPELERLMAQSHGQAAPPLGNSVFLDETDDGQARALMGPQETQVKNLPLDAFPEGAKEGQRFNADDVNMTGGKGNPFASALPGQPPPEPQQQPPGPAPRSSSMMVPGQQIRGMSAQMPQDQGGVWEGDIPGMGHVSIDPAEARAARLDDVKQKVQQAEAMMSDPTTPREMIPLLARERVTMLAQLDPQDRRMLLGQTGAMDLDAQKGGRQQEMQDDRLSAQKDIADSRNATAIDVAKMRKKGGKGGGVSAQSSGTGSAFSRLKPMEQARIENAVTSGMNAIDRSMNWTNLEGKGFDRLDLALTNIRDKSDLGGASQMEAMMNFFGYIRGGVPAENETREFKSTTTDLGVLLDKLGQKVNVDHLWTNWAGSDADKAAIAKIAHLPEGQRAGLEHAIVQTRRSLEDMATKNIEASMESYKSSGRPFHERIQDRLNGKMRFIGAAPRQWFPDSPLIPDFEASQEGSGQAGGSAALENAAQKLLQKKASNAAPGN
jgi:hypothetical protein